MTFITHGFLVSVVLDVRDLGSPLRFMLRRSSLVECASVLHRTCLQCVKKIVIHQYVQPCLSKNPKYTFYTIKSSLMLTYYNFSNVTSPWPNKPLILSWVETSCKSFIITTNTLSMLFLLSKAFKVYIKGCTLLAVVQERGAVVIVW